MQTPLQWLGGTEEAVSAEKVADVLLGTWCDERGPTYTLTQGAVAGEIDVLTVRPCGNRRFSAGLIRAQAASGDCGAVEATWGRAEDPGRCYRTLAKSPHMVWRKQSSTYVWDKVQ